MTLVRVKGMWLNPDKVIGVWVRRTGLHVTLRCVEGQVWEWTCDSEQEAVRLADEIAAQVNHVWRPGDAARQGGLR